MVKFYYRENGKLKVLELSEDTMSLIPERGSLLWIDMVSPAFDNFKLIEKLYDVEFPTKQETEEIEISSRYWESEKDITVNSYFLVVEKDQSHNETVTFILQDDFLVTIRYRELRTFNDCIKKLITSPKIFSDGFYIFSYILEVRIDLDADILEGLSKEITTVRKQLFSYESDDEDLLEKISHYENLNTIIRDSLIDKQRILSSILKSSQMNENLKNNMRIMIKDVNSLIEFTKYNFDRLDYIQNIFLGLLSIEQNKVVKIFTVVSVVFLPPTLIASIYGMNFKILPELGWRFGYVFALILMVISAILPIYIFKKKGWL